MKRLLNFLLLPGLILLAPAATPAWADDAVYTGFFSNEAIKGHDAVAYFTEGEPVEGSDQFRMEYKGAIWKFASRENMDRFQAEPEAYAPQYGGYCAYAMAEGETASTEPDLWTIHEGKLYLNYSRRINTRWRENMLEYIEQANRHWAELEPQLDAD